MITFGIMEKMCKLDFSPNYPFKERKSKRKRERERRAKALQSTTHRSEEGYVD